MAKSEISGQSFVFKIILSFSAGFSPLLGLIYLNSFVSSPLLAQEINLVKLPKNKISSKNTLAAAKTKIDIIPAAKLPIVISQSQLQIRDQKIDQNNNSRFWLASEQDSLRRDRRSPIPPPATFSEPNDGSTNLEIDLETESESESEPSSTIAIPEKITVINFKILGSSVFSTEQLQAAVEQFKERPLSFAELFQARSAITKLYTDSGYINSGAYIPPQELEDGVVTIQVLEGELEEIDISGTSRLDPDYIRSRIAIAADKPINVDSLLEALQMLRLDPLIENVSAELSAGVSPGISNLDVEIEEADAFSFFTRFDNGRSPSVGTVRRSVGLAHNNLFGFGDRFDLAYTNTDGGDSFDLAYGIPLNAKDGRLRLAFGINANDVIEEPFNPLDIESESRYYELSFRQPLIREPNQELAIGFTFSRQESETSLLDTPFALSRGAEEDGETKISALRFFQEWTNRTESQVIAARSQFSVGINLFDATINDDAPDSSFFAWRGQGQWVRRLDEDFLFLLRGDLQLAPSSLVPLEQFRLGGIDSVRGYRQDLLLGDNGILVSAELRIPIARINRLDGLLQLTPFVEFGTVWNSDEVELDNQTLNAVGLGLNFTAGDRLSARLDWGIPLVDVQENGGSLQEDGVYFSINYNLF